MELLLPLALLVGCFVGLELLLVPPDRLRRAAPELGRPRPDADGSELFSLAFVQRRIRSLADELDRLDRDRTIFARAFRTHVAQDAYRHLLDDASRLATARTLDLDGPVLAEPVGAASSGSRFREELDL